MDSANTEKSEDMQIEHLPEKNGFKKNDNIETATEKNTEIDVINKGEDGIDHESSLNEKTKDQLEIPVDSSQSLTAAKMQSETAAEKDVELLDIDESKEDAVDEVLMKELPSTSRQSMESSGIASSQDNSPTSFDGEAGASKRAMINEGRGHLNGDSGVSMEKSGNSSEEDLSKHPNVMKSQHDPERTPEDGSKFSKVKSKVKKRNYRNRKSITSDTGEDSNDTAVDQSPDGNEEPRAYVSSQSATSRIRGRSNSSDSMERDGQESGNRSDSPELDDEHGGEGDSSEWTTASEEEMDDENGISVLSKPKPKQKWCLVPDIINRQIGSNQFFPQRFYGSLHSVERLELMYKLEEHRGCVNALNFNHDGSLIASASDDLMVVLWDWPVGRKKYSFDTGHRGNVFQVKWLPSGLEHLMVTCARDGQVRLMDLHTKAFRKLATHRGPTHKLAIHPDTPHVVVSVGEDAKVFSIDVRESKPSKLLTVKEDGMDVHLYSVHSNPLNSSEFCVCGRSQTVRIYDRRKLAAPVRKFCPEHLAKDRNVHVTCAVYNYNGTEIAASYDDEDIYLFDTTSSATEEFARRYQGHKNSATVKGVNFFGPKSEYVISGSDCGNIFFWDKNTEAIVQFMQGDEHGVVNCLESHPTVPILATSGLDYDVKIWIPSRKKPNPMKNLNTVVRQNMKSRKGNFSPPDDFDSHMFYILMREIGQYGRTLVNLSNRIGSDNDEDRAEEEEEEEEDDDEEDDDSSSLDEASTQSESHSEGDGVGLQCSPS